MIKNAICYVVFMFPGLVFAASPSQPPSEDKKVAKVAVSIHSFEWDGAIPSNKTVVVNNPYGDIRARNNGEKKIYFHATYQKIGDKPLEPTFKIDQLDGKWFISVAYPESIRDKKGALRGRTDVSILLPGDVSIDAMTKDGMIKIDKTSSDVIAKSHSGKIKLSTTGLFKAYVNSGTIDLKLRGFKKLGESVAISDQGTIKAEIFSDMDISLSAATKGKISRDGKPTKNKRYEYQKGNKLAKVQLQSKTGDIKVFIADPPALVKSVVPVSVNKDLRDLPREKDWKPGDPIVERDDKKNNASRRK